MRILTSCQNCHGVIEFGTEDLPEKTSDSFTLVCNHCGQKNVRKWHTVKGVESKVEKSE